MLKRTVISKVLTVGLLTITSSGCTALSPYIPSFMNFDSSNVSDGAGFDDPRAQARSSRDQIPGVVQYVWEEPMIDVVDTPPGLDPEGHYYRPAHQSVVEVRQGRWQYYKNAEKR